MWHEHRKRSTPDLPRVIEVSSASVSVSTNDALIRDFISAWERRDSAFILNALSDDAVYHAMPLTPIVGKEALRAWVEHFEDIPPGRLEVRHQVAGGSVVINERTDTITLNGKQVTLPICAVFELADGKITAWREYFDLGPAKAAFSA
jgi:limonene-1,2-epoxide hydrolase